MSHAVTVEVGIVVAREKIDHPWQDFRWRPVSVFLDAPAKAEWRELHRGPGFVHYHAATLPLVLHRKETTGYSVNLANGVPSLYVVMREDPSSSDPVQVHFVSASPFEVQPYIESGMQTIERVAMPERLVALVQTFIGEHHIEEPSLKRMRHRIGDTAEAFGQEPIFVPLERLPGARASGGRGGNSSD